MHTATDPAATVDLLNDVLSSHQRSLLLRLGEAAPFIPPEDAGRVEALRAMIGDEAEHVARLTEAVIDRGGCPVSALPDPRSGRLHYVNLRSVLPQVINDERRQLAVCERAAGRLADDGARRLILRIADRHRDHLRTLGEWSAA